MSMGTGLPGVGSMCAGGRGLEQVCWDVTDRSKCSHFKSCFKGLICGLVLVHIFCCFIPSIQGRVWRLSIGHHSDGILDLWIQSFSNLDHSSFWIHLLLLPGLQIHPSSHPMSGFSGSKWWTPVFYGHNVRVGQAEIILEFSPEFIPIQELWVSSIIFFPLKNPGCPFCWLLYWSSCRIGPM